MDYEILKLFVFVTIAGIGLVYVLAGPRDNW